ncbi:MAG TPA: TIM barrel protein [Methylomirabilota bacterium]|nr:TIM barrel protein [Methylomirabilota bacterium]
MNLRLPRRRFLHALFSAAAVPLLTAAPPKPRFGSQLYGWGQYYQREGKSLASHLPEALSAIRDAGYEYAEGSLDLRHIERNEEFAAQLKAKGLIPLSLYSGGRFGTPGEQEKTVEALLNAAKVCKRAGFTIINLNPDPIGRPKTRKELETQVAGLKKLGAAFKQLGLQLGIHHHTPEFANHGEEFHFNFAQTDPEQVGFCYDVHWVYRGGVKPADALKSYGKRIVSWHLRQSRGGIWFEEMAAGDIDYGGVARHARANRLPPNYSVELALEEGTKITRSVVENHRRSLEYTKQVFA